MSQNQFNNESLASRLQKMEQGEAFDGQDNGWLSKLKRELELKRQAEVVEQYKRDSLNTHLMIELNRAHTVELLEEMNRVLLNREGRVEPIFTGRHELCFSWPVSGGRQQIRVGADVDKATGQTLLLVNGLHEQKIAVEEEELKEALIKAFQEPYFDAYRF